MKTIRRPRSRNKVWISAWILVGILFIATIIKFVAPFSVLPFVKVGSFIHDAGVASVGVFISKNSLEQENQKLKDQLSQVQVALDRDKILIQENTDLKELLGRHSKNTSILASILSKPPMSLYDTLIVDVGSSDRVSVGDKVFAAGAVPIGVVNAVYAHTSTVQLYSSSGQKVEVRIGKNIQTFAESQGGSNFLIKLPKGTEVTEGDPVSAPSISTEVFGHIGNIEFTENSPFIYVRFNLPVNIEELHFLQIDRSAL